MQLGRLLIGALRGSDRHRAVYLDERVRYVDPVASPPERQEHVSENLADEAAAIAEFVADMIAQEEVDEILSGLHRGLTAGATQPTRVLLVGDCLFTETRAFLTPMSLESGHPLDVRHIFFSARHASANRNEAVVAAVETAKPT